jgi:hypothetical protein
LWSGTESVRSTWKVYQGYTGGRWGLLSLWCVQMSWGSVAGAWAGAAQAPSLEGSSAAQCFCLQVWVFPGSCSKLYVAVRGIGRGAASGHVHIADSVAMPKPVW